MKRTHTLALCSLLILAGGCKKDREPNKFIDTLPINTSVTVTPALAAQQLFLLNQGIAQAVVPIVNRLGETNAQFPELTGPNGSLQYNLTINERHYGSASLTLQFRDGSNSPIDPVQTQSSTITLVSVNIGVSGASDQFNYSETLTMTLETSGQSDSKKRVTGSGTLTGSTYNFNLTFPAPGYTASFEGLSQGSISGTGSGGANNDPASIQLNLSINHDANGTLEWEGETASVHFESNGTGSIITNQYLIPIQ